MEYVVLGRTGLQVNKNGFGALPIQRIFKEEAGKLLKEGDSMLAQAHESHMGLLQKEAESLEPQVCLMIVHGEDQLMSCETIRLLVTELMEIYGNQ